MTALMRYVTRMSKPPKHITIAGIRFCRDERTGYYLNSPRRLRAHRFAYEQAFGPIQDGFHVHHVDGDKANNAPENLALMTASDHATLHGVEKASREEWVAWARENMARKARPAASDWHRSEEGRAWHRDQATASAANRAPKTFTCEQCGSAYQTKPFGKNRFCSNKCRAAARRATGADDETRACAFCGQAFTCNRYAKSRTCGRGCANRLRAVERG